MIKPVRSFYANFARFYTHFLGILSMDEKGELKVLEAPKQETAELMVVDDNINTGLIAALEDDYEALNEQSSDYVKA